MGQNEKGKIWGKKDIFIGTCYLNPSKSKKTDQKVSNLCEDVILLQEKGEVIIIGDLNARTGNLVDTISPDKSDELFELSFDAPPPQRNSRDIEIDQRGKDLIDLCKSADLRIINGRKTGDLFGDFTCIKYNGNSVVDYLITSSSIFDSVPYMIFFTLEIKNLPENLTTSKKN